jgi:DNA end-binding protein Ku
MPRAIWSGAISFGLLNVPVKLYSAVSPKTVRFHQLRASDGSRVRNKRVAEADGEEVSYEEIVKGFELGGDRHVVLTNEELAELEPKKTRTIDVEDFVDLGEIDPIYFDNAYYLAPDTGAQKAYRLLVEAMRESGKVAIARFVLRDLEHLAALRAMDGALAVATMRFHDEVVSPGELADVLPDEDVETSAKEVRMAEQLIESLTTEFDPHEYRDEHRERIVEYLQAKGEGRAIDVGEGVLEEEHVPGLL